MARGLHEDILFIAKDITYSYPGCSPVLQQFSFTVTRGECVALLGANACGKSTLLHLLNGLCFSDCGELTAFGTRLTEKNVETQPFQRFFRANSAFLFQNAESQLFNATVEEELQFGPLQLRLPSREVAQRTEDMLELFGIVHLRRRSPHTLSGGEKKKVALACLLASSPEVLLLDEPCAGLDPRTQRWLSEFLKDLHHSGVTLIMASHDLDLVRRTMKRALVISEDHLLAYDGPVDALLADRRLLASVNLIA